MQCMLNCDVKYVLSNPQCQPYFKEEAVRVPIMQATPNVCGLFGCAPSMHAFSLCFFSSPSIYPNRSFPRGRSSFLMAAAYSLWVWVTTHYFHPYRTSVNFSARWYTLDGWDVDLSSMTFSRFLSAGIPQLLEIVHRKLANSHQQLCFCCLITKQPHFNREKREAGKSL